MFRCIADPNVVLIDGNQSLNEKKNNLDNFKTFLTSSISLFSYQNYNAEISLNLEKSLKYLEKSNFPENLEIKSRIIEIEQIKENLLEMNQIVTNFSAKNFKDFIEKVNDKFPDSFFDYVLTNDKFEYGFKILNSTASNAVASFISSNTQKRRDLGYFITKDNISKPNQGLVKNFKNFSEIVIGNLGMNDLSSCEIFIIQADLLRTLYSKHDRSKDKTGLKIFIKAVINHLIDMTTNFRIKPLIYFIADTIIRDKSKNLEDYKNNFKDDFIDKFQEIPIRILTSHWAKKSEDQSRFFYSSNFHGYIFTGSFNFFVDAEYHEDKKYELNARNQLKVARGIVKFKENLNKDYLSLVNEISRDSGSLSGKNEEILKKKLNMLKNKE